MAWDELKRDAQAENKGERDKFIGIFIAILAVILAICATGGSNASKEATLKNIEASNLWAFFQAKNMRRHVLRVQVDDLDLRLQAQPDMPEAARAAVQAKIAQYREQEKLLTSEPATQEGLDELFKRAKGLEADRDRAMRQDPYFDYGQALLQIAIVLASVALISTGNVAVVAAIAVGAMGTLLTLNGFTLAIPIPFIG